MVTTKSYTFSNVTGNHTISAEFSNMTYTVGIYVAAAMASHVQSIRYKINSGSWTTISSFSSQTNITVNDGDNITVEATASSGYRFKRWHITYVDSQVEEYLASNPYTYDNISESTTFGCEVEAIPTYTITATAGTGGTITPSGNVTVQEGGSQTFQITANSGYAISRILVDGSPISL